MPRKNKRQKNHVKKLNIKPAPPPEPIEEIPQPPRGQTIKPKSFGGYTHSFYYEYTKYVNKGGL